jgi:tetratricopeptide (TPR) repeat protein
LGWKNSKLCITLNNIGDSVCSQGKNVEALDYYFKAQKIRKILDFGKTAGYAITLNNIGLAYEAQGKYAEALDYYFKAQKIREDLGLGKTARLCNNFE